MGSYGTEGSALGVAILLGQDLSDKVVYQRPDCGKERQTIRSLIELIKEQVLEYKAHYRWAHLSRKVATQSKTGMINYTRQVSLFATDKRYEGVYNPHSFDLRL